jgi:hypothetical protein
VRPRAIDVHIGELVLEGVSAADRRRIGAAVERELGRLFAEHGVPEHLTAAGTREAVHGGSFVREHGSTPAAFGAQVARAVYGGLQR